MKSASLYILLLCFLLPVSLLGQKYSNEFLTIGAGARAQGMANAAIVSTTDAYAAYWNPAGIAGIESDLEVGFMHSEWFAGVGKYDYLSVVYPIASKDNYQKRAIGLSVIRFGIDDIPNTLSLYDDDGTVNYDNVVPFSAADYGLVFTYAQNKWLGDESELYFGGNAKIIYRQIGSFAKAYGFGFDLGIQYHLKNWSVGLSVKDASSTFNAWSFDFTEADKEILAITNNDIPINSTEVTRPTFVLGGAYHKRFGKIGVLSEINGIITTDGQRNTLISNETLSVDMNWGVELDYNEVVYLRAGINRFQKEKDIEEKEQFTSAPTLGVGLDLSKMLSIDYAFTDISQTSQKTYSHVISVLLRLDFQRMKDERFKDLFF